MLGKLVASGAIISIILVAILLQVSTPANAGPLGIFALFVLVYVSLLGVLAYVIFWVSQTLAKVSSFGKFRRPIRPLGFRWSYYFASVTALTPVMIIGMQSVGDIGVYEMLLVVFFTAIACVYIAKKTS